MDRLKLSSSDRYAFINTSIMKKDGILYKYNIIKLIELGYAVKFFNAFANET